MWPHSGVLTQTGTGVCGYQPGSGTAAVSLPAAFQQFQEAENTDCCSSLSFLPLCTCSEEQKVPNVRTGPEPGSFSARSALKEVSRTNRTNRTSRTSRTRRTSRRQRSRLSRTATGFLLRTFAAVSSVSSFSLSRPSWNWDQND